MKVEELQDLTPGARWVERDLLGEVGQPPLRFQRLGLHVEAVHEGAPAVWGEEAEEEVDGGGLTRAVGAEQGVHLARVDREVEAVERRLPAETLRQAACVEDEIGHGRRGEGRREWAS